MKNFITWYLSRVLMKKVARNKRSANSHFPILFARYCSDFSFPLEYIHTCIPFLLWQRQKAKTKKRKKKTEKKWEKNPFGFPVNEQFSPSERVPRSMYRTRRENLAQRIVSELLKRDDERRNVDANIGEQRAKPPASRHRAVSVTILLRE